MREVPAHRPVPVIRGIKNVTKARDPRFDSFRQFDFQQFSNNYSFLKEQSTAELAIVREKLKEGPNEDLEIKMQSLINKRKHRIQIEKETSLKKKIKKEEIAKVLTGKKPFYQANVQLDLPQKKGKNRRRKFQKKEEIPLGFK